MADHVGNHHGCQSAVVAHACGQVRIAVKLLPLTFPIKSVDRAADRFTYGVQAGASPPTQEPQSSSWVSECKGERAAAVSQSDPVSSRGKLVAIGTNCCTTVKFVVVHVAPVVSSDLYHFLTEFFSRMNLLLLFPDSLLFLF